MVSTKRGADQSIPEVTEKLLSVSKVFEDVAKIVNKKKNILGVMEEAFRGRGKSTTVKELSKDPSDTHPHDSADPIAPNDKAAFAPSSNAVRMAQKSAKEVGVGVNDTLAREGISIAFAGAKMAQSAKLKKEQNNNETKNNDSKNNEPKNNKPKN